MVGKKMVVSCGELGEEYFHCDFDAVGETEEELVEQIIEHTKTAHGIIIGKGTYVEHILRRLVHLLLLAYKEPEIAHL